MRASLRPRRADLAIAVLLLITGGAARVGAEEANRGPIYARVSLRADGTADPTSLDRLSAGVGAQVAGRRIEIAVLVHGYNTADPDGAKQYRDIASELKRAAPTSGVELAVVGVHWPSSPGPMWKWLPQVVGYRAVSELGFRNALRNPYRDKVQQAIRTGRTGLRAVFFKLRDAFPEASIHVLAHSLGSEMVVRALSPEVQGADDPVAIEQPARTLELDLVTLAGADLDEDVFSSRSDPTARLALDRARIWWITVPKGELADAVLELRHGAGRRDAVGNRGLSLTREDLSALLTRRALVLDDIQVPVTHWITDYYGSSRTRQLSMAMAYLRDPASGPGRESVLAALESTPRNGAGPSQYAALSLSVYDRWRRDPGLRSYGLLRVVKSRPDRANGTPNPQSAIRESAIRDPKSGGWPVSLGQDFGIRILKLEQIP